jgi:bifunctional UDP-N-acetylglucosamine pyrophosphorylase/glucosamine-1-phosphate N-acetyltransferase
MSMQSDIAVVILAAGDGTRMNSSLPKVMHELHGKPLVEHVVDHVTASHCCTRPVIVVSPKHTLVQDHLGSRASYVVQEEQLGTGHAAYTARPLVEGHAEHMLVLYGDMPNLSPDSIATLIARHKERANTITMMTVSVPNFEGMYAPFETFGRIIRGGTQGHIVKSVEFKDATAAERNITEVNPGYYCFRVDWFFKNFTRVTNANVQGEYYLPDLLSLAIEDGEPISSISIAPEEAIGINTQKDLEWARTTR